MVIFMRYARLFPVALTLAVFSFVGIHSAEAQARRGAPSGAARAVPRSVAPAARIARPVVVGPRVVGPCCGYYYPGFSLGFYSGYPFGFGYGYGYGYPYFSAYYGYPYGGYPYGGYPYDGYVAAAPGGTPLYGSVRIEGAPRNAQVYADDYYVGIVDDFDGVFQHINLAPGAHRIEIRPQGGENISFDLQIQPGQTITYRADLPRK